MNEDLPPEIAPAPTSIAAFVGAAGGGPLDEPVACASAAEFELEFGSPSTDTPLGQAVRLFFANGGMEAHVVRVDEAEPPALVGDRAAATGIHALHDVGFNLLHLEPAKPATSVGVLAEAAALCRERRAVLVVDPPEGRPQDATDFARALATAAGEAAANTASYFPRVRLPGEACETAAAGGAVAVLIARTDAAHGVWQAAAGTAIPLAQVEGPALDLDTREIEELSAVGVNALRSIPDSGTVVWGARTLTAAAEGASDWKYLPVRRTALHIEKSLLCGLRWAAFEPNDERLWRQVARAAGDFLDSLWRQGAFRGATPREAYFVRCDRTTMTQDDIDAGRLVLLVGVAVLRPAEFVVIRIGPFTCPP